MDFSITERFNENSMRTEAILHIGTAMGDLDSMSDQFRDFLRDLDDQGEDLKRLSADLPFLPKILDLERWEQSEILVDHFYNARRDGWLIKVAQPVFTPSGRNSASFSWGYYGTGWFFGDSIEAAMRKALAWGEKLHKEAMKGPRKSKAKQSHTRASPAA
jgi:hypothetical protein